MKSYPKMSHELVESWPSEDVSYAAGSVPVDSHYHHVEEWLEVLEGAMTFFTAAEQPPYALAAGQALNIQPGEVHRVEIGREGVKYRMWLPVELSKSTFQQKLDKEDLALVTDNLKLPESENGWDKRSDASSAADPNGKFLDKFTASNLIFRNARGKFLGKKGLSGQAACSGNTNFVRHGLHLI